MSSIYSQCYKTDVDGNALHIGDDFMRGAHAKFPCANV